MRIPELSQLPELDFQGQRFGSGAVPIFPNARDRDMKALAELAPFRFGNFPPEADLRPYVQSIYDQGDCQGCTAYSTAAMQSIFEEIERGHWITFDADECFHACGGVCAEGVDGRIVLQFAHNSGLRDTSDGRRYRIGSFAYADPTTDDGVDAIKAALAAECPCVLGMQLPLDFTRAPNGDSEGGDLSRTFHQVCLTGYTADRFRFVNSWRDTFGDDGFGSIPIDFLRAGAQRGRAYAFTAINVIDPALPSLSAGQLAPSHGNSLLALP